MDARWTEEDGQACEQKQGLLSAAVGQDTELKHLKFNTNTKVVGFMSDRKDPFMWILGHSSLLLDRNFM